MRVWSTAATPKAQSSFPQAPPSACSGVAGLSNLKPRTDLVEDTVCGDHHAIEVKLCVAGWGVIVAIDGHRSSKLDPRGIAWNKNDRVSAMSWVFVCPCSSKHEKHTQPLVSAPRDPPFLAVNSPALFDSRDRGRYIHRVTRRHARFRHHKRGSYHAVSERV